MAQYREQLKQEVADSTRDIGDAKMLLEELQKTQSKQRGDDFRERKREAKRSAIESKRRQRIEREERKLMMSFFDSPSQFAGPAPPAEPIAEEEASDSGEAEEREPSFSRQLGDFNYRISNTLPAGASKV